MYLFTFKVSCLFTLLILTTAVCLHSIDSIQRLFQELNFNFFSYSIQEGILYRMFKYFYAPFLMKKWVRASVVIIFYGWLCSSLAVVPKIEIGLDQEISMPDDSFVLKYFNFLNEYLSVGKFNFFRFCFQLLVSKILQGGPKRLN